VDSTWQRRAEQWRRFSDWEARRLHEAPTGIQDALAWMAAAHDLALRCDPGWGSGLDVEHARHIGRVRVALARMALPA